jgi:hypothetical protein
MASSHLRQPKSFHKIETLLGADFVEISMQVF